MSVIALVRSKSDVPAREDWAQAIDKTRSELKGGDGVTWAPYWAGEGRLFFHGLPAFGSPPDDDSVFHEFKRVWRLTAFDADRRLTTGHARAGRWQFGGVKLDLLVKEQADVVGTLLKTYPQ